jgi:hypothetical protein
MKKTQTFKCSICKDTFTGFGNNPYPATKGEDDRCCDYCNGTVVIPARIAAMREKMN